MVEYAREDLELWSRLADAKYLCDDTTTDRGVHNVISENEKLEKRYLNARTIIDRLNQYTLKLEERLGLHDNMPKDKSKPNQAEA